MSLAVLADHMASRGRGPDSMLIHMSPREVQGLQALAENYGGSLTINPETGLPEANFLEKLLPTIIGAGISYFSGGTIDPKTAAMIVGGVQTVRTGDIGKGIQAGLGAYGGASLGAGMAGAGADAMTTAGMGNYAEALAARNLEAGTPAYGEAASQMALESQKQALATPFADRLSAGADVVKNDPMKYLKANAMPLLYAAGPAILAGANVQSKGPQTITKPGMIRPYSFDPYGGTYTAGTPYEVTPAKPAAHGGLMGLAAGGIAGYGDGDDVPRQNDMAQGGMYNFAQRSEPVVRMAEGGVPGYAGGMLVGDQDVFNYFKGLDQSKLGSGALDTKIANDMQTFNVSAADIARITGQQGQQGNFEQRFVQAINPATLNSADFLAKTADVGLTNQALVNAMQGAGMSKAAQYAATHTLDDTAGISSAPKAAQDFYSSYGYKAGDAPGDKGGLAGLYANIDYAADQLQAKINAGTLTVAQAQNLSLAEMERLGINQADIKAATGSDFATLFTPKTVNTIVGGSGNDTLVSGGGNDTLVSGGGNDVLTCPPGYHKSIDGLTCIQDAPVIIDYKDCGTGYHWDKAAQACVKNVDATQTTTDTVVTPTSLVTADASTLPVGVSGTTGPSIFGGGATVNPNGTITTSPVIPGIPVGGFTGMESLRKAYTDGGGSLGYTPYTPKTIAEFNTKYNTLTGGSKAAYDYLTGKTPYSPTPVTPTGQIFKPYSEAMGIPQDMTKRMYIFDPVTKTYKRNPDYKPPAYATAGTAAKEGATGSTGSTGSVDLTDQSKPPTTDPGNDNEWVWDYVSKKWYASPIQRAAAGGLMAMARGDMAQQFDLGGYSDGGRLLRGPGDGVSDSIPATIGNKRPARLADGEFVVPARIVSELGNGSTEAGARKLYAMMDRVQKARQSTVGKGKVAKNSRSEKYLPA